MLCQIEKNKIFQVKTISKDVWKAVVSSFMFLFNYFQVCHPLCKENKSIQFSPLNQWNKHTWFSRKILVFYRKRKIKNTVVLDVRSAAHLEAFLIKQGMLMCAEACACDRTLHMPKPYSTLDLALHPCLVDQMSTRNSRKFSSLKKLSPSIGSTALRPIYIHKSLSVKRGGKFFFIYVTCLTTNFCCS